MNNLKETDRTALEILLKLEAELTGRIAKLGKDLAQQHSADSGDQAIERENDEVLAQLERDAVTELRNVQQAKQRLEQGRYYQCAVCGGTISAERLLAIPYTSVCINCSRASAE